MIIKGAIELRGELREDLLRELPKLQQLFPTLEIFMGGSARTEWKVLGWRDRSLEEELEKKLPFFPPKIKGIVFYHNQYDESDFEAAPLASLSRPDVYSDHFPNRSRCNDCGIGISPMGQFPRGQLQTSKHVFNLNGLFFVVSRECRDALQRFDLKGLVFHPADLAGKFFHLSGVHGIGEEMTDYECWFKENGRCSGCNRPLGRMTGPQYFRFEGDPVPDILNGNGIPNKFYASTRLFDALKPFCRSLEKIAPVHIVSR